jgi:hypothetical protein
MNRADRVRMSSREQTSVKMIWTSKREMFHERVSNSILKDNGKGDEKEEQKGNKKTTHNEKAFENPPNSTINQLSVVGR